MSREKPFTLQLLAAGLVSTALAIAVPLSSLAKSYEDEETTALLQALNNSKVGMAEGVQQLTKGAEAVISAKYEFDDNKKLSLSVYTAEKGLGEDPEHNAPHKRGRRCSGTGQRAVLIGDPSLPPPSARRALPGRSGHVRPLPHAASDLACRTAGSRKRGG